MYSPVYGVPVVIQCEPEVADGPLDLGTVSQGPKSVPAVGFSLVQAPQQQTSSHLNKWKKNGIHLNLFNFI